MQLSPRWFGCALSLLALTCSGTEGLPGSHQASAFNSDDWELVTPSDASFSTVCAIEPDGVMSITGKPTGYLQTKRVYMNYRATFEWRWNSEPGNSGLLVHIGSGPLDRKTWPLCLQIQLKHGHAGDLLPMAGASFAELGVAQKPGRPAQVDHLAPDSEVAVGEWNRCELVAIDTNIEFTLNGVTQSRVKRCVPSSGRIGFQLEGAPYQLRSLSIVVLP